ncbi:MAG: YraN family protein [Saccharofermentanales bacterium]
MKTAKREIGDGAEEFVADYMRKIGYEILTTNFIMPNIGEIDIIARHRQTLYFVEVKARSAPEPFEGIRGCISNRKLAKIKRCSDIYLQKTQNQMMYARILGAFVHITPMNGYEKIQLFDIG